jgi:hypothetical protein
VVKEKILGGELFGITSLMEVHVIHTLVLDLPPIRQEIKLLGMVLESPEKATLLFKFGVKLKSHLWLRQLP